MNQADEAWVQKLYRYNAPKLYKVVLRRLEDAEAAQDIVQEAFLALIEKIELVKCHPNPVGWLMKAVHFLILQTISTNQNKIPILTCRTQMFRAKKHYKKLSEKEKDFSELM